MSKINKKLIKIQNQAAKSGDYISLAEAKIRERGKVICTINTN